MTEPDKIQTAQDNFSKLCAVLDENQIKYEKNAEALSVHSLFKGKQLPVEIIIKFNPQIEILTVFSPLPFTVKEESRKSVAVAAARINFALVDGSFDFNYLTGKIIFKLTASFANCVLGKDALEYALFKSLQTVKEFGGKLSEVGEKNMTVDQIYNFLD